MKVNNDFIFLFVITILLQIIICDNYNETPCDQKRGVYSFNDCRGVEATEGYYCCYINLSYLGKKSKYCWEFTKESIDNDAVFTTIDKIQKGLFWDGEVQTYDVYQLICDKSNYLRLKYINLLFLFISLILIH